MATISDVTTTPLSGRNYVDALLDRGPAWNYVTSGDVNTISYTFSVLSGNQAANSNLQGGVQAFNAAQQAGARSALAQLSSITGVQFVETASGTAAQVHFAYADIVGPSTSGLCSWSTSYSYTGGEVLTRYSANAYVYLDNVQWGAQNATLNGGQGLETLLHELGHMMGLKHPFDGSIVLPTATDSTVHTLMSYTHSGGPYTTYGDYDVAALKWLYGGDGLGGKLGINSSGGGRYYAGTSGNDTLIGGAANDKLEGGAGNDSLDGGAGIDSAYFAGSRSNYKVSATNGVVSVSDLVGRNGTDVLSNIERLDFGGVALAVDIAGNGGLAYRLYQAAFNRTPDVAGVGFWIGALDNGVTQRSAAQGFIDSAEFKTLYGASVSNVDFVARLYDNILHRAPDTEGYNFWLNALNSDSGIKADILSGFSESAENQAQVIGAIQNGFLYTPYS